MSRREIPEQIAVQPQARQGNIPLRTHRTQEPETRVPVKTNYTQRMPTRPPVQQPVKQTIRQEVEYENEYEEERVVSSRHKAGFEAGMHPEDTPYLTDTHTHPDDRNRYPNRLPTSTRRYVPVRQRETRVEEEDTTRGFNFPRLFVACLGVFVAAVLLAFLWIAYIQPTINNWSNEQAYGYPRIFRAEANVGHGTKDNPKTRFIAINNGGLIELIELQEGMPDKTTPLHGYVVTKLVGDNADLIPVTSLTFHDIDGDGKVDVQIIVNGTLYVLLNDGKTFKV